MRLSDRIRFVRQNTKKNKMRIGMTVLATAMGCAFLIVLASVGFGLHRSVIEDITGGRLLTEISVFAKEGAGGHGQLKDEDIRYLESVDDVKSVTRRKMSPYSVNLARTGEQDSQMVRVIGMDGPSEIKAGFELDAGGMPARDNEMVIGYQLAEALLGDLPGKSVEAIVGMEVDVRVNRIAELGAKGDPMENEESDKAELEQVILPVRVVGIAKAPTREWQEDLNVYTDFSLFDAIYAVMAPDQGISGPEVVSNIKTYNEVKVYAEDVEDVKGIAETIRAKSYLNHSIANELDQVNVVFLIMKIGLILVGTIAILIASIGIYNTMTMAVTERSQDIGIMKAIGMHPKTVKSIFLIESSYIGLLGAAVGTAVAYGISLIVNFALPVVIERFLDATPPDHIQFSYIPLSLSLLCVTISIAVAILSGLRPAAKATRIDVLRALRRDI